MSQVGFEPAIPLSKQTKPVHALDSAATVIGFSYIRRKQFDAQKNKSRTS
jgi:hypothetical protein